MRSLREAPGCLVVDKHEPGGYITPMEAAGEDATYISRIREDADRGERAGRSGSSPTISARAPPLNAVQIAELIINRKLLKKAA